MSSAHTSLGGTGLGRDSLSVRPRDAGAGGHVHEAGQAVEVVAVAVGEDAVGLETVEETRQASR